MASQQQEGYRERPVRPQAPLLQHHQHQQLQSITSPSDYPPPPLHHRSDGRTDRKRRRSPSYSRSRSPNSHRGRNNDQTHHHRSRSGERHHAHSPNIAERSNDRRHRRRWDRKRCGRSGSRRPSSPSASPHRGSDRRRGRRRSRSVHSSMSSNSSRSRRDLRRHRKRKKEHRRKSSQRYRCRRSTSRGRHRSPEDRPPQDPPVGNEALARAGIVSDEDGENHKRGPNVFPPRPPEKDSERVDGGATEGRIQTKVNKRSNKKPSTRSSSHDDTIGHFKGREGYVIADRYRIEREVGMGTFGRVVECLDLSRRSSRRVAVKIVRSVKRYYESALIEADIVEGVNRRGGRGVTHCAIMYDAFTFSGHYCMVFEKLGPSLYDFQKRQKHRPFPLMCVRDFAQQLLETLEFLHSFGLVHTDLKPENILLINSREVKYKGQYIPESTRIKVIDFGAATYDREKKSSVVNTRQYRAPEVILGVGWSMPSDLWSLGCILVELFQGELLFATHDDIEHLALIEQVIGAFPRRMLKRGKNTEMVNEAFDRTGAHRMERVLPRESYSYVKRTGSLESLTSGTEKWFLSLLRQILVTDPDERATARDALRKLQC